MTKLKSALLVPGSCKQNLLNQVGLQMLKMLQNYREKEKVYPAIVVLFLILPLRVFLSARSLQIPEVASVIFHWNPF